MKTLFRLITVFTITTLLMVSCKSTSIIQTSPKGATVYIDGVNVGPSPVTMSNRKVITSCTTIRLEKEGYKIVTDDICRDEEPAIGPIVAGFIVYVPFLWAMKYKAAHFYELPFLEIDSKKDTTGTLEKELIRMKDLFNKQLITEEEYKNKKKQLLIK